MTRRTSRVINRARPVARTLACTICFGIAGLVWSTPRFHVHRLRKAATCTTCASHRRMRAGVIYVVALLLLAGASARPLEALSPEIPCGSRITRDGEIEQEPRLRISPPPVWNAARHVLVAPISGVGLLAGRALGMEPCSRPPMLVMFWPPPRTSAGGTMLGDVFVAWMPGSPASSQAYGIGNEGTYIRYGPNIAQRRIKERQLSVHESRHVNQWAVTNFLAGPAAFPVAYAVDGVLFPGSRNHFERAAGLSDGGYPPAPDNWPAPLWPQTAALALLVLIILRRRIRWLARIVVAGRSQLKAHAPRHCPVHTRGWSAVRASRH
ncbi:hypothetical protein [Arthrobacter castelli]|uniref:hypothetical protein n=1 Tax=Arthrobacter castelli TaxID=271431 RepID=UPI0012DFAA80|nr:hypothetical protein [Arthrobacter castelli]